MWIAFFSWAPLYVLIMSVGPGTTWSVETSGLACMLIGLSAFGFAVYCSNAIKCPRCGNNLETRASRDGSEDVTSPLTTVCLHCGIKVGAPKSALLPPVNGVERSSNSN
jgi:hypothetical protein